MKRTTLNYWTDAVAFAGFVFLATTGILLRYQLPPGSGRVESIGGGRHSAEKTVSALWGLTRHEWGNVHYYIALALMAVLAFHLALHWKWIVCVTRGKPVEGSGYRLLLGILGLAGILLLATAPLAVTPTVSPRSQLEGKPSSAAPDTAEDTLIRGDMTLEEVEAQTGVPASFVLARLGLPQSTPSDEKLGRLRRDNGFEMQDVRRAIAAYHSE